MPLSDNEMLKLYFNVVRVKCQIFLNVSKDVM